MNDWPTWDDVAGELLDAVLARHRVAEARSLGGSISYHLQNFGKPKSQRELSERERENIDRFKKRFKTAPGRRKRLELEDFDTDC